jgi:hypothetical protein
MVPKAHAIPERIIAPALHQIDRWICCGFSFF